MMRLTNPFIVSLLILQACAPQLDHKLTEQGVSWELATYRAASISDIRYDVNLVIPDSLHEAIEGNITFHFHLDKVTHPVIIDFNQPAESVLAVHRNENPLPYSIENNHIVLLGLETGDQSITIDFIAGDISLNRNPEYLYTLFVPDRASFAIPLFDQPNLKARFTLSLTIPDAWEAVANGPLVSTIADVNGKKYQFGETKPISTYLFSFAAGKFEKVVAEREGLKMTMFHRETDQEKVARNASPIFDLHHTALTWLESYTGIDYPFQKFDFVLIPTFQYGGMEHPGAIQYRASSLFLDESATQNQYLGRASLIAHETAHMWFGDLVTMNWFDDVWTKEVFANFMAAKIANPTFPEINHDLRFLLRHYPSAYSVDRTAGANPIRQPLENLQMAGTLYGAIIYQKAPIVMRQLEQLVGEDTFREGMRTYLDRFQFANATWDDLIAILDALSPEDLRSWSTVWVDEPGRPIINTRIAYQDNGTIKTLVLDQHDPADKGRIWNQRLELAMGYADSLRYLPVQLSEGSVALTSVAGELAPNFILPQGKGIGYGLFNVDQRTLDYLSIHIQSIEDPVLRGVAWTTLWDAVLEQRLAPAEFIELCLASLSEERDQLNIQRILGYLGNAYWQYLPKDNRLSLAPALEKNLLDNLRDAPNPSLQSAFFNAFRSIVLTDDGLTYLRSVWDESTSINGLKFSERDFTAMAAALVIRLEANAEIILDAQQVRIKNPDRLARFKFVRPALSPNKSVRDSFFDSLQESKNREQEPWVLDAIGYLHHPLRHTSSEAYILPSLELVHVIQQTGDIFFPKRWLDATLGAYQTQSAATTVRAFLDANPNYPYRLRNKILQSADELFRAAKIVDHDIN